MKNRRIKHRRIFGLSADRDFRATSLRIIIPMGLLFILFVLCVYLIFIPFMEAQLMALVSSVILVFALLFVLYIILESVKSERKRMDADEKLHESGKMFRTLCEEAPFGISITGSDLRYEYLNPKFIALFGYTQTDIPDKETWFMKAYPHEDYREKVRST